MISLCLPNFSKRSCLGDGNCLFRAFSDQLYKTENYWYYIRQMTVEILKVYRDEFSNFIDESDTPNADYDCYLKKVSTSGEWSGDLEIRALSVLYQIPVEIYDHKLRKLKTYHDEQHPQSVNENNLVFRIHWDHNPGHFSSVVKKGKRNSFPLCDRNYPGFLETKGLNDAMELKGISSAGNKIATLHNQLCHELKIPNSELHPMVKFSDYESKIEQGSLISVITPKSTHTRNTDNVDMINVASEEEKVNIAPSRSTSYLTAHILGTIPPKTSQKPPIKSNQLTKGTSISTQLNLFDDDTTDYNDYYSDQDQVTHSESFLIDSSSHYEKANTFSPAVTYSSPCFSSTSDRNNISIKYSKPNSPIQTFNSTNKLQDCRSS